MNTVLACVFLIALGAANAFEFKHLKVVPESELEDKVNETIEAIRALIPDPWIIDSLTINAPDNLAGILTGSIDIKNAETDGLAAFQVTKLTIDEDADTADFTLVLPKIVNHGEHSGSGTLLDVIPLTGSGTLDFTLTQVVITGSGHLDRSDGVHIDNVKATLTIGSNEFKITGLLGSDELSELVNTFMSTTLPDFINNNPDVVSDVIGPLAQTIINLVLDLLVNNGQ